MMTVLLMTVPMLLPVLAVTPMMMLLPVLVLVPVVLVAVTTVTMAESGGMRRNPAQGCVPDNAGLPVGGDELDFRASARGHLRTGLLPRGCRADAARVMSGYRAGRERMPGRRADTARIPRG
jgi:hypothetical protein